MSVPVVSIIVPNYNHSKFLEQRLASIFNQTYQAFEVIILDDCSTDNSRDIIERYRSNPKVSNIIYNEVNSGSPFKQWYKGIQLAKGEYVWIAESDDYCTVDFLQKNMVAFEADTKCAISFCRTKSVNEVDCHCEIHPLQSGENKSFSMKGFSFSKRYMKRSNFIVNASSAVFCKGIAINIDPSYTEYYGRGDIQFWIEIASHGNIHYLEEPLNFFRQHTKNTTKEISSNTKVLFDMTRLCSYLRRARIYSQIDYIDARVYIIYMAKYLFTCSEKELSELMRLNHSNFFIRILVALKYIKRIIIMKESQT